MNSEMMLRIACAVVGLGIGSFAWLVLRSTIKEESAWKWQSKIFVALGCMILAVYVLFGAIVIGGPIILMTDVNLMMGFGFASVVIGTFVTFLIPIGRGPSEW